MRAHVCAAPVAGCSVAAVRRRVAPPLACDGSGGGREGCVGGTGGHRLLFDEVRSADISKGPPGGGVGGKKNPMELDSGKGGGVAVITRPRVDKKSERKSKTEKEPTWRVLLHNDDVHTFDYVTGAIVAVVRTVSRKKAHRITMQAHSSGVATVTTTWKALANEYCKGLQLQGLTSSIAPDSSFKT